MQFLLLPQSSIKSKDIHETQEEEFLHNLEERQIRKFRGEKGGKNKWWIPYWRGIFIFFFQEGVCGFFNMSCMSSSKPLFNVSLIIKLFSYSDLQPLPLHSWFPRYTLPILIYPSRCLFLRRTILSRVEEWWGNTTKLSKVNQVLTSGATFKCNFVSLFPSLSR